MMNSNLAYEDESREELINGELVAMSPSPIWKHVSIAGNIYNIFKNYLKGKKCIPIPDGFDLHLTEKDIVIPDMMVVCDREKVKPSGVYGAPDLVVEVLSPRTVNRDRGYKMKLYAKCGVREYWIVSPASEYVEVYLLNGTEFVLDDVYTFQPWTKEVWTEEEKAHAVTCFKCSLYDDLEISLDDIFSDLLP